MFQLAEVPIRVHSLVIVILFIQEAPKPLQKKEKEKSYFKTFSYGYGDPKVLTVRYKKLDMKVPILILHTVLPPCLV